MRARELLKIARRERTEFDCALWVHDVKQAPKEDFKREVKGSLTSNETESLSLHRPVAQVAPAVEEAVPPRSKG